MFHRTNPSQSAPSLDLTALKSYSPQWSPNLRLATCIAVQYAVQRHTERANALSAALPHSGQTTAQPLSEAWRDYGEKFLTALCQHLGVQQETLPPGPIGLEDVLTAAQGRVEQDRSIPAPSHFEPKYESGSDHMRRFPDLDLPIRGVDDMSVVLPPDSAEARKAEMQNAFADLDLQAGSADESEKFTYDQDAQELPEFFHEMAVVDNGTHVSEDDKDRKQRASAATQDTTTPIPAPKRIHGVIESSGQEIELCHELLLIALGLGQYRAQDGSTTLFEQDVLFGEPELHLKQEASTPTQDSIESKQSDDPQTPAFNTVGDAGKFVAGASMNAFTSLKSGTITGWGKLASASKGLVGTEPSNTGQTAAKRPAVKPVKPNEVCHYDARARSLIFVAITSMGIQGSQIWLAEKLMAQTIYFIMNEGNKASLSKDGKGLIERLPTGASLDTRTGDLTQASQRSEYMNQHSGSVVEREREKVSWGKWAAMGGGFIAGGLVIGVTGGLAAPLIAPALVGLTGASFLATSGGIVMLGTLFGLGGGGLAGYKVERRLRGVSSFSFAELQTRARKAGIGIPSLHATICCSGLLLEDSQQVESWKRVFEHATDGRDAFAIECEADMMKQAGTGLRSYMLDNLIRTGGTKAAEQVVKKTALAGIAAITLPLSVFNAASATLDGVFVRAKTRSHKAGLILAETLRNEVQGHRPVILIGTSLGAATILTALTELAKDPENTSHLIDSVVLVSAPITPSPSTLKMARSIVQRRFINAFSSNDMVCGIAAWLGSGISVEELKAGKLPRVIGSRAIDGVPGLENINISDIITSHFQVNESDKLARILDRCGALTD